MPTIYNVKTGKKCRCEKDQTDLMLATKQYSLEPPEVKDEEPKKEAPKQEPQKQEAPKTEVKKEAPKAPSAPAAKK